MHAHITQLHIFEYHNNNEYICINTCIYDWWWMNFPLCMCMHFMFGRWYNIYILYMRICNSFCLIHIYIVVVADAVHVVETKCICIVVIYYIINSHVLNHICSWAIFAPFHVEYIYIINIVLLFYIMNIILRIEIEISSMNDRKKKINQQRLHFFLNRFLFDVWCTFCKEEKGK